MYSALASLIGALITVMNVVNTRLVGRAGVLAALLVIHVVGLAAVSLILIIKREKALPGRLPFYAYLGGFVGVGTVFAGTYAFAALGASLAVALALIGQTLFAVTADATGFMGRTIHPLTVRRLPGMALAAAGAVIMVERWSGNALPILVALLSGVLPGVSFILNSELGRKKGLVRSTRVNYIVGLATTLVLIALIRPPAEAAAHTVAAAGPVLILGGGLMGVVVVTGMSVVFPRVSAFSATLLLYCGQAVAGVLMDAITQGFFDARKLVGTLVLLVGLTLDTVLSRRAARGVRPSVEG